MAREKSGREPKVGRRHYRRWWIGGALVVALVIGAAAWWTGLPWSRTSAELRPSAQPTTGLTPSTTPTPRAVSTQAPDSATPVPRASVKARSTPFPELKPKRLDSTSTALEGLTAAITKLESVAGKAVGPGEVSGPAIRVTFKIKNNSTVQYNTAYIAINAYRGADRVPLGSLTQPGGRPFEGTIPKGGSTTAVYLFAVPQSERGNLTIVLDYRAGTPAFVFHGDAAKPFG